MKDNGGLSFTEPVFMDQLYEFIGNHPILSGAFVIVLIAWLGWEVARLGRKWRELDSLAAVRLINQDDAVVIDVSNSTDYAKGHIVGAINVTQSRIESGNKELLKLSERPVLIYCKNGQNSPAVANKLVTLGFTDVNVLAGGLAQWLADQQPISRAKGSGKAKDRSAQSKGKGGKKKKRDRSSKDGQAQASQEQPKDDQSSESPSQASESSDSGTRRGSKGKAADESAV